MRKAILPLVLSTAILFLTGVRSIIPSHPADDDLFELKKNFEIFGAAYEEIVVSYVNHVRPQPFMKTGIDAMLRELDPYTRYYDQADNVDMAQMRRGPQATIGLNIGMQSGQMTVLAPEGLTSGYRQGVQVGDKILRVDGVDVSEITVRDVVVLIRGEAGSSVKLDVERPGQPEEISFLLQREVVKTKNVSFSGYLGGDSTLGIGYVRLDGFGTRAAREVRRAFRTMQNAGELKTAVLDLRNNPGGLVSEAVELVGLFVEKGTPVVSVRGRTEKMTTQYVTENDPLMVDIPLIVLVNRFSASSSEIVSGALQDLDRAVIIGETTFGKGLVQVGHQLPYNTSMRITVGHYYTPGGRDIQSKRIASRSTEIAIPSIEKYRTASGRPVRSGVGIEPDLPVATQEPGELQQALSRDGAFFQFAGEWVGIHFRDRRLLATADTDRPNAGYEGEVGGSDSELYEAFRIWLREQDFEFKSSAGHRLDALREAIPEQWDQDVRTLLDDVQEQIEEEKEAEFVRSKPALLTVLKTAITSRILDQQTHIAFELAHDCVVQTAVDLSGEPDRYQSILSL